MGFMGFLLFERINDGQGAVIPADYLRKEVPDILR
jgi:hypothetical protein